MIRVLFVCMGNICRSPTAEAVFRHKLAEHHLEAQIECDSAGTTGHHAGEAPDRRAQKAAMTRYYKMSDLRARQVQDEDFEKFDLILAMDHRNLAELRRRSSRQYQHKLKLFLEYSDSAEQEVPDPYYGGHDGFEHVLDLVENASDGLLRALSNRGPA
ncbi:MAG TPA: low molecular weight protein-tyrosine-phosphatase [Dongiaceae bacterium]|nr:low molecular weight protein-tyrosine-phosphatase [Dongiaceae bacterium]